MKKNILLILILILFPLLVFAEQDCPFGEIDDPYPGKCTRHVDTNNDQLCDHSQIIPKENLIKDNDDNKIPVLLEKPIQKNKKTYHLLPISLLLIALYIVSHILSKKRIINIAKHRKIWNLLLLISFLISGILGILLVIRINFGITTPLPFNMLFWHVEMGIVMTVISIFHIIWHWAYFKTIFKK